MSSLKKIRDNIDKLELKTFYGKEPKNRCSICHRFSFFTRNKVGKVECIRCHKIME